MGQKKNDKRFFKLYRMNGLQEVYSIFFPEIFYLSKEGKQAMFRKSN